MPCIVRSFEISRLRGFEGKNNMTESSNSWATYETFSVFFGQKAGDRINLRHQLSVDKK